MIRRALVVVALGLGCSPLPLPPFELDVSSNCNEIEIEPIWNDLDDKGDANWTRVIAAVADAPDSEGAWLLVVAARDDGEDVLAVVHLGPEGVVVVEDLPHELSSADDFSFVAGPTRGQAWLVEEAPGLFQMRRYEAEPVPARVAVSVDFVKQPDEQGVRFPDVKCIDESGNVDECVIDDWPRHLVFLDGLAYLVSLPPSSGDASVDVLVGRLDSSLESVDRPETLNFAPDCDPDLEPEDLAACEAIKASMVHPVLAILGVQPETRTATTSLALYRETLTLVEGASDVPQADVAFVVLGLDKLNNAAGNLVSEPTLYPPTSPTGGAVVVDSRAMYVQYESGITAYGDVVVQKATLDDDFDTLSDRFFVEPDSTLLQLDEDLALGRVVAGTWQIVKLFPDAPNESKVTIHDPGTGIERVVYAGPGSFLVHERDGGPDLVRLRCGDEPAEDAD